MGADEELRGVLARVTASNGPRWQKHDLANQANEAESWLDVPDPDAMPTDEAWLYEWDRRNCILTAEWHAFWREISEHERNKRAEHGARYLGVDKARAAHEFRKRLMKRYGATEPPHAWRVFDDERRARLGKEERPVFPTTGNGGQDWKSAAAGDGR